MLQSRRHYGYEVATEGDAFVLAFHCPLDAVAWCLSVQHALLSADWPEALFGHQAAAIRLAPDADGACLLPHMSCGTCIVSA